MTHRNAWACKLLVAGAVACLATGCDMSKPAKPQPPYKDPPPDQRIKSQEPRKLRNILVESVQIRTTSAA